MSKKIAVIGCGRISGHHCRSIASVEGLEISAVCDLSIEKANNYSKEFNVPAFNNYRQMLSELKDIDLVVIATPSGMHFEHTVDIMENYKKDIVVEKPTFMKPSQVDKAFEVAKKNNLNIFPVFQNRYNKAVSRVRQAIQNDELGTINIITVRVRWCRPQRYYNLSQWRGTYAMDGGALTNQGIHHVDLLRNLGGEVKKINAIMRTFGAEIEVEDTCLANFEFVDGKVGTLEVTTSARPDDFEASLSFVGSKGFAQIGGIAVNELQVFTPAPSECKEHSEDFSSDVYGKGHRCMYEDIARFYFNNIPFQVNQEDCYNTIKLLHSFYNSALDQSWYELENFSEKCRLGEVNEKLAALYRTPR